MGRAGTRPAGAGNKVSQPGRRKISAAESAKLAELGEQYADLDPRSAYAAWSYLTEAHDYLAKALVQGFGPAKALSLACFGIADFAGFCREIQQTADLFSQLESDSSRENQQGRSSFSPRESPSRETDLSGKTARISAKEHAQKVLSNREDSAKPGSGSAGPEEALAAAFAEIPPRKWATLLDRLAGRIFRLNLEGLLRGSRKLGIELITPIDPLWCSELDQYVESPFCLWALGNPDLLRTAPARRVAVVGSRIETDLGAWAAAEITAGLVASGYQTISGGAFGIDSVCHRSTLNQRGDTIAVMASGLDRFYPAANERLFQEIRSRGLLVSQYPIGTPPARWRFLDRNWLVAALSGAVVVVQASRRSGALNTATHAQELGKTVGVVPGPVNAAPWAGSLELIRSGATLVRDTADVLEILLPLGQGAGTGQADSTASAELGTLEQRVYDAFPYSGRADLATLRSRAGLDQRSVFQCLDTLLFEGLIRPVAEAKDTWERICRPGS